MRPRTIVLQSQRPESLGGWQGRCRASVETWARRLGYVYRFEDDSLFDRIPTTLRERFIEQRVVIADLARLLWLREVLEEGFERAVWVDADVLLFGDFDLPAAGDYLGREVWIQPEARGPRTFRKVHNAWLQFDRTSVFLPYYIDRASTLLERVKPPVVPQFIGPKLLSAWHNIVAFNVEERIGMCSPVVLRDLLRRGRERSDSGAPCEVVKRLIAGHEMPICGLNLCASYENREVDGVRHGSADYEELIDVLFRGLPEVGFGPGVT